MVDGFTGGSRHGYAGFGQALDRAFRRPSPGAVLLVGGLLLIAALASANCSNAGGSGQASADYGTRTSEAGKVTVDVTWAGPAAGLVFDVVLDTHSVDLDGFDLANLASLRTDGGIEVAPIAWDAAKGGHHREGKLSFPATVDGRPLLNETVRGITVLVRDVASPERSFQWTW